MSSITSFQAGSSTYSTWNQLNSSKSSYHWRGYNQVDQGTTKLIPIILREEFETTIFFTVDPVTGSPAHRYQLLRRPVATRGHRWESSDGDFEVGGLWGQAYDTLSWTIFQVQSCLNQEVNMWWTKRVTALWCATCIFCSHTSGPKSTGPVSKSNGIIYTLFGLLQQHMCWDFI